MRWIVFIVSVLLIAGGVFLGFVLPAIDGPRPSWEIGRFTVYASDSGFAPADVQLYESDGPTGVAVSLRNIGPLETDDPYIVRLEVRDDAGELAVASELGFAGTGVLESPQTRVTRFDSAQVTIDATSGLYKFSIVPLPGFPDTVLTTDVVLSVLGGAREPQIPDYAMIGLGVLGLLFSLRPRRRENPNSQPPPPRWGRGQ